MKPKFIDEYGHKIKAKYKDLTNAERHERTAHHCLAYQNTGHKLHIEALWDLTYVYILSLQFREPAVLKGYAIEEVLGEAYLLMERVAKRFNPKFGVPFVMYFRLSLAGHLTAMRLRDNKYLKNSEEVGENLRESRTEMVNDRDQALYFMEQLDNMPESEEVNVTKAYITAYLNDKLPRRMVIAGYSGKSLKELKEAVGGVAKIVDELIL